MAISEVQESGNTGLKKIVISVLRAAGLNRVAGKLYYKFVHGFSPAGRDLPSAVTKCFKTAQETGIFEKGDYCEFGIFKGFTFLHAQKTAIENGNKSMRFFGFDSFEGLPPIEGADVITDGHQPFYEGQYSASRNYVTGHLDKGGVDWDRTFLVEGYFDVSLASQEVKEHNIENIAIALVDCDLYSSTVDCLEFLGERLVDGAIVIMDDWKSYDEDPDRGQPKALDEFLAKETNWRCEPLFDYGSFGRVFTFRKA